ncbi:MAG: prolipoprotein diacylglyceryl transferase, partial [Clostridia bacterium]|nr:prolipoprotein diacylglyceryl transferase [Clostridia bacterium]
MLLVKDGFSLFGLDIKFYGVIIALGMLIAILVVCKNCKTRDLKADDIFLLALYVLPLAIIGARLYYVLFADHSFSSFWEVFDIRSGG